jgi:Uma2 family endonuclease
VDYARIRAVAEELAERQENVRVEISGSAIVMLMSSSRPHELIAMRLRRQLDRQLDAEGKGLVAHTGGEVEDASLGKLRRPDLIVVAEEIFAEDTLAPFLPRDLALVGEIVSPSNHVNDYAAKMPDYPAMGIPLYLLIDPRKGTVAVLSDPGPGPDGSRYRARHDYAFGDRVQAGPWTIDTNEFPTYN